MEQKKGLKRKDTKLSTFQEMNWTASHVILDGQIDRQSSLCTKQSRSRLTMKTCLKSPFSSRTMLCRSVSVCQSDSPSVRRWINYEPFRAYCPYALRSCPTVRDWGATYPALLGHNFEHGVVCYWYLNSFIYSPAITTVYAMEAKQSNKWKRC